MRDNPGQVMPFSSILKPEELVRRERARAETAERKIAAALQTAWKQKQLISALLWRLGGKQVVTIAELKHDGYAIAEWQDRATGAVTCAVANGLPEHYGEAVAHVAAAPVAPGRPAGSNAIGILPEGDLETARENLVTALAATIMELGGHVAISPGAWKAMHKLLRAGGGIEWGAGDNGSMVLRVVDAPDGDGSRPAEAPVP